MKKIKTWLLANLLSSQERSALVTLLKVNYNEALSHYAEGIGETQREFVLTFSNVLSKLRVIVPVQIKNIMINKDSTEVAGGKTVLI